jgi:DNA-binding response OmpR family regulator
VKILLVEDDEATTALLASALVDDRHTVNIATDGQMGLMLAETYDYDLILLDVLVPKLDGISLCRQLRSNGQQMPILLLTARDSQTDKVMGLDAGADDYVVKPFDLEELKARIRALLRRSTIPLSTVLTWEQLRLDPDASVVTYQGHPIALTPKEFSILELFLRNPHRVFSRSAIIDRLWSLEESPAESAVTTHIKDLRQKLKAGGMTIDVIDTVYGLGYRLKSPTSQEQDSRQAIAPGSAILKSGRNGQQGFPELEESGGASVPAASVDSPSPAKRLDSIHQVIEKFRNSFVSQISVLQQAETALLANALTAELREQARQEAHKLSGSLGIFGYPQGSQLAHAAEALLANVALPYPLVVQQFPPLVAALQQELAHPVVSALPEETSYPEVHPANGIQNPLGAVDSMPPITSDRTTQQRLLCISADQQLVNCLQSAAPPTLQIQAITHPEVAWQEIARRQPDGILLDLSLLGTRESGLSFLTELAHRYPDRPVLVLSEQNSLSDRVEVSRLGGKAFLSKPVGVKQILQAIQQAVPHVVTEARILIVDDDAATLAVLRQVLQPWGLQVTTLAHPQQFWDALIITKPDLVVFDLEMPTFSGIDLCQVVRHDPQWGDLPILVVTSHTDADSIRAVFAAGADDFITKPVVGPELVTRILSRIERVRRRDVVVASRGRDRYDETTVSDR